MNRQPGASTPRDRGAVAVEFALLLPVLLLLLFGIIDFGRLLNAQLVITQAATEGARLQALGLSNVASRTQTAAAPLTPVPAVNTGTACPNNAPGGTDAVVIVTYTFTFLTPVGAIGRMFGSNDFGTTLTLTAQGEMPCET
jgi:Flp pilus assembly protein TadG